MLELNKMVTISDVASLLQKFEVIHRVSAVVKKYLVELGREGLVVNLRLIDLTRGLEKEENLILKDYFENKSMTEKLLEKMVAS